MEDIVRHLYLLPLALLCAPLSCAAAETETAAEEKTAARGETADTAPDPAEEKLPRLAVWGDYRWLYGKARMELPSAAQTARREEYVAPSAHCADGSRWRRMERQWNA